MQNSLWYLKNYNLFESIPEKKLTKIAGEMQLKECREECPIYHPLEIAKKIFIVKKGEVALYKQNKNGHRYIFDTLGPGSLFGHLGGDTESYGHHAMGRAGVCVCVFDRAQFLEILAAYPDLMLRFMQDMSAKIAEYQDALMHHHADAEQIILHELERLHYKRQQGFLGSIINRPLRATHQQIAEITGLNRVTVTRTMRQLREKKKISYDAKTGIITLKNA